MAVPLVQITGKVVLPDGTVPSSGGIACELSQPGSVLDGVTSQRVASRSTATIAVDGSVTFSLVPNDAITPSGTCYLVYVWAVTPSGVRSWQETWQLASAPSPINVGAIPRLNVVPGVALAQTSGYDLTLFWGGYYEAGQILSRIVIARAFTLPAGLTGSQASAGSNPTAQAVISIRKNGVEVGTLTIATNGAITLAAATAVSFAIADLLSFVAPVASDATLADVALSLLAVS